MREFIVLALIAVVAFASTDVKLEFISGENLTDSDENFKYRYQSHKMMESDILSSKYSTVPKELMIWSSTSVDVSKASSKDLEKANNMLGVALPPSKDTFPIGIAGYGVGKEAAIASPMSFLTSVAYGNVSSDFKDGLVVMVGLSIEEINRDGKTVADSVIELRDDSCTPEMIKGKELLGMTCTMSPSSTPAKITVTFVTAKQAGIIKYGHTPVSPSSIDMIIQVDGFKIKKKDNHMRLKLALITASGAAEVEGTTKTIRKEERDDVYVSASNYSIISGKRKEVNVTLKSGYYDKLGELETILKGVLGDKIDMQIVNVDYPAGVDSFTYDPALGCGSNVYLAGANTASLSLIACLLCVLIIVLQA